MSELRFFDKTPKTWITEICVKRKVKPRWDTTEKQKTPPAFQCVCTVPSMGDEGNGFTAEGIGSSKKLAEQRASQKMLDLMGIGVGELYDMTPEGKRAKQDEMKLSQEISKNSTTGDNVDRDPVSDTDDDNVAKEKEPIGELNTVCARHKLGSPEYNYEERNGQIRKIFIVTCTVGSMSTFKGRRLKTKDAKKLAAFRVLNDLRNRGYNANNRKSTECPTRKQEENTSAPEISSSSETTPAADTSEDKVDEASNNSSTKSQVLKPRSGGIAIVTTDDQVLESSSKENETATVDTKLLDSSDSNKEIDQRMDLDENEDEQKNVARTIAKLKRRFSGFEKISPQEEPKRKFELAMATKLVCKVQSENCVKFIKDYVHIFQHLPTSTSLDEALMPRQFESLLNDSGGPLETLRNIATDLNFKIQIVEISQMSVFIQIKLRSPQTWQPAVFHHDAICVHGEGKNLEEAKVNATLKVLKVLRLMLFTDNASSL